MRVWLLLPLDVPVDLGRDEARRRALDELAKAKYGGNPEWVQRALDVVRRIVEWLVGTVLSRSPGGGGFSWGFLIAVVVLLGLIALVVWRVGLPRFRRRRRAEALDLDPSRPADDYRAAAEQAAARGDWRDAVRDRFRAVVRDLEVRTVLDVRPARTAWEAAWAASQRLPTCRDALHDGAATFNDVVYGEVPADADAYAALVALDAQVVAAADTLDLAVEEPEPVR